MALDGGSASTLTASQRAGYSVLCTGLVLFSGLMSGLTLGLLSLDRVDLEVLKRSGTETQKKHAAAVAPLVNKGHQLLVTLLLMNAAAMETLPLFLDQLTNPVGAILISVTMVLIFGEIVPQAICQRFGLAVGYNTRWVVWLLLWIASPLSIPLAKVLDRVLGKEEGMLFRRPQLKALVDIHGAQGGHGGDLSTDETTIISGALDMTHKSVESAMTPVGRVRSVCLTTPLTWETLQTIMGYGHSRLPVHAESDPTAIVGLVLVKELFAALRREDLRHGGPHDTGGPPPSARTIGESIKLRPIPRMNASTPLYTALNYFQTGRSHMAVITRGKTVLYLDSAVHVVPSPQPGSTHGAALEQPQGVSPAQAPPQLPPRLVRVSARAPPVGSAHLPRDGLPNGHGSGGALASPPPLPPLPATPATPSVLPSPAAGGGAVATPEPGPYAASDSVPIIINIHPGAGVPPDSGSGGGLGDGQVLGILTLEDVLEELLQEEILDETDVGVRGESLPFAQADHAWS